MDANPFDQFDPASATPVATPPISNSAPAPTAPVKPVTNAFDQFDQSDPTKAPPTTPTQPRDDLPKEAGIGLLTGLPNMAMSLADAQERGMRMGATIDAIPVGMIEPLLEKIPGFPKQPEPQLGKTIGQGLSAIHANPNDYFPEPQTAPGRIARATGEGAVTMLVPGAGEAEGWAKLGQVAKDLFAGATGGFTSQAATEVAPEPLKPAAGLIGGFVGGGLGMVGAEVPHMIGQATKRAADYVAPAIPGNTEKLAASKLGDIVSDRPAAIEALNPPTEIVPGSRPTAFQASGDTGIGTLERAMARSDPKFKESLLNRLDEQSAARVSALENVTDPANPSAVADYFKLRMQDLEGRADSLYSDAQKQAQDAYQGLGDQSAAETGAQARAAIEDRRKALNTEANHLWDSIDPKKDLNVATGPLVRSTARVYGMMGPEEMLSMTPAEKSLAGIIGSYGEIIPFQRFKQLRTAINSAMADAKRGGQNQAYGRLTQLRSSVEEAVHDSIAGKVAEQQQGVAAGQMSEDDTMAANFLRQAKEWYAQREGQTGTGVAAGNGVPEAGGSAAVPGPDGAARPPVSGPTGTPGVEGLPANAHIGPETGELSGQGNQPTGGEPRVRPAPGTAADRSGDQGAHLAGREPDGSLVGLPRRIGNLTASVHPEGQRVAADYMNKAGLDYAPPKTYAKVDPARAKRIADAYDAMKDDPQNPEVKRAYGAMVKETLDQYQAMLDAGMKIEFIPKDAPDPYKGNPRNMTEDVRNNHHMWVFPTDGGFGSDAKFDPSANPLLAPTPYKISGRTATANDIFRAVHDYFGHVKEGVGFRADGEENAWRSHSAMYSPLARKAMTSETRGQNSWVNFGPYGEHNRTAKSEDTHYADQKVGLLPDWAIHEGAGDPGIANTMKERWMAAGTAPDVAAANAAIVEAYYNQMAARSGMTPEAFAKKYPLPEVERATSAPEGSLKQSAVDTGALADFINTPDEWLDKEPLLKALKPILKEYKQREEGSLGKFESGLPAAKHADLWKRASEAVQKHGTLGGDAVATQIINAVRKFMGTPGTEKTPTVKPPALKPPVTDFNTIMAEKNPIPKGEWESNDKASPTNKLLHGFVADKEIAGYAGTQPNKLQYLLKRAIEEAGKDASPSALAMTVDNIHSLYAATKELANGIDKSVDWDNTSPGEWLIERAVKFQKYTEANKPSASTAPVVQAIPTSPKTIDHIPGETKPGPTTYQSIPAGVADIAYAKANPALLETPAFKEFFKESAAVDRKGNPLVVYHGTRSGAFRHFNSGHSFFAADPRTSSTYAGGASSVLKLADPERMLDDPRTAQAAFNDPSFNVKRHPPVGVKKGEDWYTISHREPFSQSRVVEHFSNRQQALEYLDDYAGKMNKEKDGGSGLHAAYLSIQNPHEVDWEGRDWNDGPNGEDAEPRYSAYIDGEHYDTYSSYDDAQEVVDKHLEEIRKSAESEARDKLQQQFEIKAPTPLFGDHSYHVKFLDENGDVEDEMEPRTLESVQDYIESTIDQYAKDAGHEAVDNANQSGDYSVHEEEGEDGNGHTTTDRVVDWARNQGDYDGVIFRNIKDPASGQNVPATDVYVPFSPNQIKSTANLGSFNANSNRLLFQSGEEGPRAAYSFNPNGAALISMLKGADASSGVHELGHHFLEGLRDMAAHPEAPEAIKQDWNTVRNWWGQNAFGIAKDAGRGVLPGDVQAALDYGTSGDLAKDQAINVAMHEHWARGFESYLRDGVAPNRGLAGVFHQFKQWLGQIYKSASDLKVNLSPEMKGVFDRILGTPDGVGAKPVPRSRLIDKAAADRFAQASAATRNMKETFGAKPVASIIKRPGGNTMPYGMTDEAVSSALWRPGAEGAAHIKAVLKAGPGAGPAIEQAAVQSMKRAATKDGVVDPQKLAAWRAKHADALTQVPSLDRRLGDAAKATDAMVQIGARRAAAIKAVQKTAIGKLLKVSSDADVTSTVGSMLNRTDAVRSMRELTAEAKNDPQALAGLQRAVVDYMIGRLKTPKDALRADTFQRFLGKTAPALSEVLHPEQMNSLRAIAQDLKRATKDVRAPGGGSDTAENLAIRSLVHQPTLLGKMLRLVMDSGIGTAVGLLVHPLTGVASAIGTFAIQSARERGLKRVDDLIKEAILDPDLMRTLLMKAPKKKNTGSHVTLGHQLAKLALFTANRAKS